MTGARIVVNVAIVTMAFALGFVGGVWFLGSGAAFRVIREPKDPTLVQRPRRPPASVPKGPLVVAVAVPRATIHRGGAIDVGFRADRTDLLPTPGCQWVLEPWTSHRGNFWRATDSERLLAGYTAFEPGSGALLFALIQATQGASARLDLRPVFFDAEAHRHVPETTRDATVRSRYGLVVTREFRLDPAQGLARDQLAYVGIEHVPSGAARQRVEAAQEEARKKGIAILPPILAGARYPFDLPTADGQRVRSDDLHGKVVLVTVWGPGTGPLSLMNVERVRKANRADVLAIVGVSFEGSTADARETLRRAKLVDLHLVVVPNDPETRRIWCAGAEIDRLPMNFLVDREGILRFATGKFFHVLPMDLEDHVDILFGRSRHPHFPRPVRVGTPAAAAPAPAPARETAR